MTRTLELNGTDAAELATCIGVRIESLMDRQKTMPSAKNATLIVKLLALQRDLMA